MHTQVEQALLARLRRAGCARGSLRQCREDREDVDPHVRSAFSSNRPIGRIDDDPAVARSDTTNVAGSAHRDRARGDRSPGSPTRASRGRGRSPATSNTTTRRARAPTARRGRRAARAERTTPLSASAASRVSTPSKCTTNSPAAGATRSTRKLARRRRRARAPGRLARAGSVTRWTTTSPRSPCGSSIEPDLEQCRQSTNSTSTSTPSRTAAARTTVRIDWATRPRLPITRPMSPAPTLHLAGSRRADPRRRRPRPRRDRRPRPARGTRARRVPWPPGCGCTSSPSSSSSSSSSESRSSCVELIVEVVVVDVIVRGPSSRCRGFGRRTWRP